MAQARRSGCFVALVTLVALGSLGVVGVGMAVGGWYWWSSQAPSEALVQGGPWTLTVDNPNDTPMSVSCALESSPPVEIAAHGKGTLTITTLPVSCAGTTPTGEKVLDFHSDTPPTAPTGWSTKATPPAAPAPPPLTAATTAADTPEARAEELAQAVSAQGTTPKAAPARPKRGEPAPTKPAPRTTPTPAPPPTNVAPLMFKYPGGPKFAEIEVSVDGRDLGTRPTGTTVTIGTHTVQFYADDLVNISCPIDVDADGRVVSLPRKLTCPAARE